VDFWLDLALEMIFSNQDRFSKAKKQKGAIEDEFFYNPPSTVSQVSGGPKFIKNWVDDEHLKRTGSGNDTPLYPRVNLTKPKRKGGRFGSAPRPVGHSNRGAPTRKDKEDNNLGMTPGPGSYNLVKPLVNTKKAPSLVPRRQHGGPLDKAANMNPGPGEYGNVNPSMVKKTFNRQKFNPVLPPKSKIQSSFPTEPKSFRWHKAQAPQVRDI